MRLLHEKQMHEDSDYITLTYAPEHLPGPSLRYRDFQLFMRRTRKHLKPKKIRFYMAGEYGEEKQRPHFHAIIFGHTFAQKSPIGKSPAGFQLWRSAELNHLWPYGHGATGTVTFESCAYVARYLMKKITGDLAPQHYQVTDLETGEIIQRTPEFTRMSLKPGIGKTYLDKYKTDIYPEGQVVINGKLTNAPKYYDKLNERENPDMMEQLKYEREIKAKAHSTDNTNERLAVKEQVLKARSTIFKRKL